MAPTWRRACAWEGGFRCRRAPCSWRTASRFFSLRPLIGNGEQPGQVQLESGEAGRAIDIGLVENQLARSGRLIENDGERAAKPVDDPVLGDAGFDVLLAF